MQPMRAVHQRIFIERAGSPCLLENVRLDEWSQGEFTLTGHLPMDLNLASPQTLCLVFQDSDDPWVFWDEQRSGMILVFDRFRVVKGTPLVLMRNEATGKVTMPIPEFGCTCGQIQQWTVTNGKADVTIMMRR